MAFKEVADAPGDQNTPPVPQTRRPFRTKNSDVFAWKAGVIQSGNAFRYKSWQVELFKVWIRKSFPKHEINFTPLLKQFDLDGFEDVYNNYGESVRDIIDTKIKWKINKTYNEMKASGVVFQVLWKENNDTAENQTTVPGPSQLSETRSGIPDPVSVTTAANPIWTLPNAGRRIPEVATPIKPDPEARHSLDRRAFTVSLPLNVVKLSSEMASRDSHQSPNIPQLRTTTESGNPSGEAPRPQTGNFHPFLKVPRGRLISPEDSDTDPSTTSTDHSRKDRTRSGRARRSPRLTKVDKMLNRWDSMMENGLELIQDEIDEVIRNPPSGDDWYVALNDLADDFENLLQNIERVRTLAGQAKGTVR